MGELCNSDSVSYICFQMNHSDPGTFLAPEKNSVDKIKVEAVKWKVSITLHGHVCYMVIYVTLSSMLPGQWPSTVCGCLCYMAIFSTWSSMLRGQLCCVFVCKCSTCKCASSVKGNQLFNSERTYLNIHDVCIFTFQHAYSLGVQIHVSV